ncbi:glycosyltransferase family 4 protein [Fulvivirga sediminis]|uniref:Glycosyltransferase family 4 protein n=1 Tax=Fulvivirga sediminis TaxID=2803949 RepID=A0A937K163_9BACT|nr:glycosyltransferase family 4 protein [Fulvivirga sediminis]MBL3659033.1 glycosyltransferase family 4 protein [Fulvivirga sediminis]
MKNKIGITGGGKHAWVSVDRTRRFYIDALQQDFDLVFIDNIQQVEAYDIDLLLNFAGNIGWEVAGKISCPVIYCAHGGAILNQDFLYEQLPNLRDCDGIIVNCHSDIEIFESMCGEVRPNFYYLPLPVNEDLFNPMDQSVARDVLGIPEDTVLIGHISRLLPQKNLHRFLHLFAQIAKELDSKDVKALIVGNFWVDYPVLDYVTDTYPQYIEDLISDLGIEEQVIMLPAKLSDEELLCCYNALDILIHPTHSLDENFGYVPVEAMACGVAVIGSAYGGLKDTIKDGVTGFVMPTWVTTNGIRTDESLGIDKALQLLQLSGEDKMKVREACINHIDAGFTYEHCARTLVDFARKSIDNYDDKNTQRIQVNRGDAVKLSDTSLPATKSGTHWEMYYEVVSHYVSQNCADFVPGSKVYTAYPWTQLDDETIKLDDPTWPATYTINGDRALLDKIGEKGLTYHEAINQGVSTDLINKWLQNGLLAITKIDK